MPTIGWDETLPSNASSAALGDDEIRSLKTNISGGLGTSMYFPGTAGGSAASAGIMKLGAARTFYAAASAVSAAQSGQLMVTSDTSRLYYVGPTGPMLIGGGSHVEYQTHPGAGYCWTLSSGVTQPSGVSGAYGVTYLGIPRVVVSAWTQGDVGVFLKVTAYQSGFSVVALNGAGSALPASSVSVPWFSLGSVAV